MEQYVILCLRDKIGDPKEDFKYVQTSRRRFSKEEAEARLVGIAPSRRPVIVGVPSVPVDEMGYPISS